MYFGLLDTGFLGTYAGMRLLADKTMVNVVEDWSKVRSPSRAARRRKMGHRQRITYREVPKPEFYVIENHTIVAHPLRLEELLRQVKVRGP
jgi:hypothetical protein